MIPWTTPIPWTAAAIVEPPSLSHRCCPACAAPIGPETTFALYAPFVLVHCAGCDFAFVGNPLSPDQLNDYYRSTYACDNTPAYHAMQRDNARMNMRWIRRHSPIAAALRTAPAPTSLDVGAGFGYLVEELRRWGFDASGIEPSPFQREFGTNHLGVRLTDTPLDQLAESGQRFDLVTVCDVIEHVVHPREIMEACGRLLKPDGRLVVKTDNFQGLVARLMGLYFYRQVPIEHVSQFTPMVLDRMAADIGFRVERTVTWTPGCGLRWAVKLRVLSALGRRPALPDPVAKNRLGNPPSRLARMTDPLFALAALPFDRLGGGCEFLTVLRRDAAMGR